MDSEVKLYFERAESELRLARAVFNLSIKEKVKLELGVNPNDTFYSAVISHSYYGIFYCAKSFLISKGIKTKAPEEHKKTYLNFKKFVVSGEIDSSLERIYGNLLITAGELLKLFSYEKKKRGRFTYKTLAEANRIPAKESVENATKFLLNIKEVLKNE